MNLSERIIAVAEAANHFSWLGEVGTDRIREWIELELGSEFESPRPYGRFIRQTIPLTPILHIVSGNTPHAAVQSLIRGILIGSKNRVKTPMSGLPELETFIARLPAELRPETNRILSPGWLEQAEAIVVFGSDDTIRHFARQIEPHQRFVPHGTKISFGLVLEDYDEKLISHAAKDVFLFDQLGCLSPQSFFVANDSSAFAARLAQALDQLTQEVVTKNTRSPEIAARLRAHREEWKYRAATEPNVKVWESPLSLEWTVIHSPSPSPTPLYCTIFVHPMTGSTVDSLASFRPYISTIGLDRLESAAIALAIRLGAQRICPIGAMQNPPLTWHHDGWPSLASLVRYVDIES
jgi:acyl-CoA reductase LuxC